MIRVERCGVLGLCVCCVFVVVCCVFFFFFLMIRRPPRSTQSGSSAASDVYKGQVHGKVSAIRVGDQSRAGHVVVPSPVPHNVVEVVLQRRVRTREIVVAFLHVVVSASPS